MSPHRARSARAHRVDPLDESSDGTRRDPSLLVARRGVLAAFGLMACATPPLAFTARPDTSVPDVPPRPMPVYAPRGASCDFDLRLCLPGLTCTRLTCFNSAGICVDALATCEMGGLPVCACDGRTLANRCAALVHWRGIAWQGECYPSRDAALDGATDATVDRWRDVPPGASRCRTGECSPGERCCLTPGSDRLGSCVPMDADVCR